MTSPVSLSLVPRDRFVKDYAQALHAYLRDGGEAALALAYELGRRGIAAGFGVVEMVLLHHASLSRTSGVAATEERDRGATFLAEALSPFEMTHRGFRDTAARLDDLNRMLQRQNEELEETARSLQSAKEQTEQANRELDAFSYSVAHDLRAPLRSIDGFSFALLEEHGAVLDEGARGYLERVRGAVRRMGQLIDDLLALSRVSRAELHRRRTDLSEIVAQVADELHTRDPVPEVVLDILPAVEADVDIRLIRIVFENLLGNSWKFTAKTTERRIQFGTTVRAEGTVYFVRDNGAGFDMRYVGKLFSPFQRLHTDSEFSGTGIGLATVSRIIARHGGRVWAEGAVGLGATIFFTLAADAP